MKETHIGIRIFETEDINDFSVDDQELISASVTAAGNAWSPYSGFSVGAAVKLSDGTVVTGCNIENASFPAGICAEHNALSSAASLYPDKKPAAMAITAFSKGKRVSLPVSPCGKCRQVIAEEELRHSSPIRIIMAGSKVMRMVYKGSDLLPLLFSQKDINPASH